MTENKNTEAILVEVRNRLKAKNNRPELFTDAELEQLKEIVSDIEDRESLEAAIGRENLDYILTGIFPEVAVHSIAGIDLDMENIPPCVQMRPQVFLLGAAGSGKTSMLSGLIHYALKNKGAIFDKEFNPGGFNYVNALNWAIERNRLIRRNQDGDMQFFTLDFKERRRTCRFSFYEMAGETFLNSLVGVFRVNPTNAYDKIHPKLKEHIFESNNPKIFFLVIDYEQAEQADNFDNNQGIILSSIVADLKMTGVINSTRALVVLFTKWDKAPEGLRPEDYLKEKFYALDSYINNLMVKYRKLIYTTTTFSLGDFEDVEIMTDSGNVLENKKFSYKTKDPEKIYNWLCSKSLYKTLK